MRWLHILAGFVIMVLSIGLGAALDGGLQSTGAVIGGLVGIVLFTVYWYFIVVRDVFGSSHGVSSGRGSGRGGGGEPDQKGRPPFRR